MPRAKSIVMTWWVLVGLIGTAAADFKDQAKKDVAAGLEAQSFGHYDDAIVLYKKAYDAVPHPEILFNLAQAYRLKGDVDTALGLYQRYLAVEPKGRVAADARRWSAELEKLIAKRKVDDTRKTEDAKKADEARKADEAKKAEAAKIEEARKAEAAKIEAARKADETRKIDDTRKTDEARKTDDARKPGPSPTEPRDEPRRSGRGRYAVIAAAAGGAAVIGGAVFGVLARTKQQDATAICGDDHTCDNPDDTARANKLLADSRTRGNVSTVMFAVGGVGLVVAGVLWWTGRGGDAAPRTAIAPVLTPSSIGFAAETRF